MRRPPLPAVTDRLQPLLEAVVSLTVILGLALSVFAVIGVVQREVFPSLLLVAYLMVPLPAAMLVQHLLSRE